MIKLKVSKADLMKVKKELLEKANDIRDDFAVKTYNSIVTNESHYPYWTGSYISSWNITVGDKKGKTNKSDVEDEFSPPAPVTNLTFSSLGQPVYISNYAEHAYQVEYLGTGTHHHEGWFTANHALNTTRLSYKYTKV